MGGSIVNSVGLLKLPALTDFGFVNLFPNSSYFREADASSICLLDHVQ